MPGCAHNANATCICLFLAGGGFRGVENAMVRWLETIWEKLSRGKVIG